MQGISNSGDEPKGSTLPEGGRQKPGRWDPPQNPKKEEFPGAMRNMTAGNSFPQICVVSETHSEEIMVT
jgi:hypothetical protein